MRIMFAFFESVSLLSRLAVISVELHYLFKKLLIPSIPLNVHLK